MGVNDNTEENNDEVGDAPPFTRIHFCGSAI